MGKGDATKQMVLDQASRLAARMGLDGLSIGILASELGLSKSGLFAHFGSKEALQMAILEHGTAQFTDYVVRPALQVPRGCQRLQAMFERWLSWLSEERTDCGCLFISSAADLDDRPGPVRQYLVDQQVRLLAMIARIVADGRQAGHFRPEADPDQVAFELYGIILSFHQAQRLLGDPRAHTWARTAFDRLVADISP